MPLGVLARVRALKAGGPFDLAAAAAAASAAASAAATAAAADTAPAPLQTEFDVGCPEGADVPLAAGGAGADTDCLIPDGSSCEQVDHLAFSVLCLQGPAG